jgi:hypothetical protein
MLRKKGIEEVVVYNRSGIEEPCTLSEIVQQQAGKDQERWITLRPKWPTSA